MKKYINNVKKNCLIFIIFFLIISLYSTNSISKPEIKPSSIEIKSVQINLTYLDTQFEKLKNMSDDFSYSNKSIAFKDNVTETRVLVYKSGTDRYDIHLYLSEWYNFSSLYWYNLSNFTKEFLINLCSIDISNIIYFISNTNLTEDYHYFSLVNPRNYSISDWWNIGPIKIDHNWYYYADSYTSSSKNSFEDMQWYILIIVFILTISLLSIIIFKKIKSKNQ